MTPEKSAVRAHQFGVVCRDPVVQLDAVETLQHLFPGASVQMFHGLSADSLDLEAMGACTVLLVIGPAMHFDDPALPQKLAENGAAVVLVDCNANELTGFGLEPIIVQQPFTFDTLTDALRKV